MTSLPQNPRSTATQMTWKLTNKLAHVKRSKLTCALTWTSWQLISTTGAYASARQNTVCSTFHLCNKEANRELVVYVQGRPLP